MLRFARSEKSQGIYEPVGSGWVLNLQQSAVSQGQAILAFRRTGDGAATKDFQEANHVKYAAGNAIVAELHDTSEYKELASLRQRIANTQKELAEAERIKSEVDQTYSLAISMGESPEQAEAATDDAANNVAKLKRRIVTMTALLPDAWTEAQRALNLIQTMSSDERMARARERGQAAMAKLTEVLGPLLEEFRMATDIAQSTPASGTLSAERVLGPRPIVAPVEASDSFPAPITPMGYEIFSSDNSPKQPASQAVGMDESLNRNRHLEEAV